jgi:ribosome biogenesis GTPase A
MAKTMRIIEESAIQQAQIVVEVRDARIPFTGMNSELDRVIQQRGKMRIVVLNKADLAGIGPGPKANRIAAEIKRYSPGVMDVVFTNCASQNTYRSGVKKVLNKILDNMPGKFKTTPRVVLVVGAPNVRYLNYVCRFYNFFFFFCG